MTHADKKGRWKDIPFPCTGGRQIVHTLRETLICHTATAFWGLFPLSTSTVYKKGFASVLNEGCRERAEQARVYETPLLPP